MLEKFEDGNNGSDILRFLTNGPVCGASSCCLRMLPIGGGLNVFDKKEVKVLANVHVALVMTAVVVVVVVEEEVEVGKDERFI